MGCMDLRASEKLAALCTLCRIFYLIFSTPCFHRVKTMCCSHSRAHDADDMHQHHDKGLHREHNEKWVNITADKVLFNLTRCGGQFHSHKQCCVAAAAAGGVASHPHPLPPQQVWSCRLRRRKQCHVASAHPLPQAASCRIHCRKQHCVASAAAAASSVVSPLPPPKQQVVSPRLRRAQQEAVSCRRSRSRSSKHRISQCSLHRPAANIGAFAA